MNTSLAKGGASGVDLVKKDSNVQIPKASNEALVKKNSNITEPQKQVAQQDPKKVNSGTSLNNTATGKPPVDGTNAPPAAMAKRDVSPV